MRRRGGPRPSRPRRRCPPEPTVRAFLVPGLRTAPRRRELPAITCCHCRPVTTADRRRYRSPRSRLA
ncbi:hypothetical protein I553_5729 [Mycobacterium xenopi 4042]|uniref:Uncharacterized protein n=1 Tax=Mycobacterium xenopi 4042 TaxID=1299334 RepID=X7ZZ19_MYCXE|nr:hypothetical protein I553_5729 [Mycobacterium xenopi 4042]